MARKVDLHEKMRRICIARGGEVSSDGHERVLIFADGRGRAMMDGEIVSYLMDARAAKSVIDDFDMLGERRDVVFDYEHQTLGGQFGASNGKAPAAGWITKWDYVAGEGLYALVEWTDEAVALMKTRQYRYHSPVFGTDDDDRVVEVHSVALTNSPATLDIEPIAASAAFRRDRLSVAAFRRLAKSKRSTRWTRFLRLSTFQRKRSPN